MRKWEEGKKKSKGKKEPIARFFFFFLLALFFACNPFSEHLEQSIILFLFTPLNPDVKIQLLILCPYMFSMEVVERIC